MTAAELVKILGAVALFLHAAILFLGAMAVITDGDTPGGNFGLGAWVAAGTGWIAYCLIFLVKP